MAEETITVEHLGANDSTPEAVPPADEGQVPVENLGSPKMTGEPSDNQHAEDFTQEVFNTDGEVVETSTMLATVKKHMDANDWKYEVNAPVDGHVIIKAGNCKGTNGSYTLILDIKEESSILRVYVKSPINFPSHNLTKLAVFLTRANYSILCGNFELDMNDGEVRYKNAIDVSGSFLSDEMVHATIGVSLITMDRYFTGIVKVAYDAMSPEAAIEEVLQASGESIPPGQ